MLTETQLHDKRWAHELDRRIKSRHNYTGCNNHRPAMKIAFDYVDATTIMYKVNSMLTNVVNRFNTFFRRKTC